MTRGDYTVTVEVPPEVEREARVQAERTNSAYMDVLMDKIELEFRYPEGHPARG